MPSFETCILKVWVVLASENIQELSAIRNDSFLKNLLIIVIFIVVRLCNTIFNFVGFLQFIVLEVRLR